MSFPPSLWLVTNRVAKRRRACAWRSHELNGTAEPAQGRCSRSKADGLQLEFAVLDTYLLISRLPWVRCPSLRTSPSAHVSNRDFRARWQRTNGTGGRSGPASQIRSYVTCGRTPTGRIETGVSMRPMSSRIAWCDGVELAGEAGDSDRVEGAHLLVAWFVGGIRWVGARPSRRGEALAEPRGRG